MVINSTSGCVLASVQVRACVKIATKQPSWRLMGKDHVLPKKKVKIFIDRRHGLLRLPGMNTGLQGLHVYWIVKLELQTSWKVFSTLVHVGDFACFEFLDLSYRYTK